MYGLLPIGLAEFGTNMYIYVHGKDIINMRIIIIIAGVTTRVIDIRIRAIHKEWRDDTRKHKISE